MLHAQRALQKTLQNKNIYNFAGFGKSKPPTSKSLDNYDVFFIGSNLGGICSHHFEKSTHEKYSVMVSTNQQINQIYPLRSVYEMQKMQKTDYLGNAKQSVHKHSAFTDFVGVKQIKPEENKVVLDNGREVGYGQLVIASGQDFDIDAIPGFEAAWEHEEHPVYAPSDHPKWKGSLHKYPKWHYNFCSGDAYFCIPKFPFRGEVETYNFFISDEVWTWFKAHGKQHPNSRLIIVNANDRFVQYNDAADQFIKEQLAKRGIEVIYNTNLESVEMDNYKINIRNLATGETEQRDYNNLYSIIPCKKQQFLVDAGLTNDNGLVDVNRETLQHNKYKNIFALGDCADLPTTRTFFGGWQQVHAVRNNLERALNGQSLNGTYDGYTKAPLYTSQSTLTFVEHFYDQKASWQHLKNPNDFMGSVRQKQWSGLKKKFLDFYLGKTWGAPYYKFKKTFKELPGESGASESTSRYSVQRKVAKSVE